MFIENFFGWLSLIIVALWVFITIKKNPLVANFIFTAFIIRALFVILDQYFLVLPGSTADAIKFEQKAQNYSDEYGLSILLYLFQYDSFFLSRFLSLFYTVFDHSPMMAKNISVFFGTATVLLTYRLSSMLWGDIIAIKAGWFAALFPSLILYSAIILREPYITFFILYTLIACTSFIKKKSIYSLFQLLFGFFILTQFHGALILGLFFFTLIIAFSIIKKEIYNLLKLKLNFIFPMVLILILLPIILFSLGSYKIPKLGSINTLTNFELRLSKISVASRVSTLHGDSGASYPKWLNPSNFNEFLYLTPTRIIYFLYSPFPWDVKRTAHILGLLDGILFLYLTFCAWQNKHILFRDPLLRFLILIFLMYIFIHSWGVGNFGTGLRHRSKFVVILIAVVAPKILKINLSKKS